jgi:hypothetical protein
MSIYLAPKVGAVALAISVVCGQVIASIFYDQYGLLGYPKLEISPSRIIGAAFLILAVIMVSKKNLMSRKVSNLILMLPIRLNKIMSHIPSLTTRLALWL